MSVFTKTNLLALLVFTGLFSSYAQFRVLSEGSFYSKGNTVVYSNEETTNDGVLSFETGKLIVDKNFTNNSPTSSTSLATPFFNMTRATLQVGAGGSASNVAQTLQFRDFPTWSIGDPSSSFGDAGGAVYAGVHTPIDGFDQILHLIVNKNAGDVSVDRGVLHLTSLDPLTTGDGVSTFSVLSPTVFSANHRVTMRSSSVENTAVVGPSNNNAQVNDIVVERYIPAKRAFRFLSPTTTGGTVNSNWQEGVNNTANLPNNDTTWGGYSPTNGVNNNPYPGYGVHISGRVGQVPTGVLGNGADSQPSANASSFTFDNVAQQWTPLIHTLDTPMNAGDPYRITIRGDRSHNINFNPTSTATYTPPKNTILRTTGELSFGDIVFSGNAASASQAFLFGNPYQSAVDINTATKVNVKANGLRVWDPTLSSLGSWVTVDIANGLATGGSSMNRFLQPGQAFVLEPQSVGPISITFSENDRIVNEDLTSIFDSGQLNRIDLRLYTQESFNSNGTALAGIFIDFNEGGDNNYNYVDINHSNNIDETIASLTDDYVKSSMQNRNLPADNEIVKLDISRYRGQNYTYRLFLDNFLGRDAFLKDNFTNSETAIIPGEALIYNFSVDSQISSSVAADRFEIVFRNSLNVEVPFGSNFALYPNPNTIDKFYISTQGITGENVKVSIVNMLGQVFNNYQTTVPSNGIVEMKINHLAEGVYNVTLTTDNDKKYSAKLIRNN